MSPTYGRSRASEQTNGSDFSLLRLIEAVRRDGNPAAGKYEAGLSQLQRQRGGIEAASRAGHPIPDQRLVRDLVVGTATAGGNLVASGIEAVVAATRPTLVLERLGATVVDAPAAQGFSVPIWSGDGGSWIGEGSAAPMFSGLQVSSVTFSAKAAAARVAFSRRLAASASQAIEPALLAELERAVRAVLEQGFIAGTGSSNQPVGLVNTPGLGVQSFAGATPTHSELAAMVETAGAADADLGRCRWLMHPATLGALLTTQVAAGSGEMVVSWADGAHRILGFELAASTHMPEGSVMFGDFSTVRLAYFGAPQLVVDTFSNGKSATGDTELVLINYTDVGVTDASQLVLGSG